LSEAKHLCFLMAIGMNVHQSFFAQNKPLCLK